MKKLFYLLIAGTLAGGLLTGCEEEEKEAPGIDNFAVNGVLGASSGTHEPGSTITFEFKATDDNELKSWSISKSVDGSVNSLKSEELSGSTKEITYSYTVSEADGKTVIFTVTVIDADDEQSARTYTATISSGVNSYSAKLLGAHNNASTGSFLATTTGTIYTQATGQTNSDKVDIAYFYGATNLATLAAPSDADAATLFTGTTGLNNWTVRNVTLFKKTTLLPADFIALSSASSLSSYYTAGTSEATKANQLQVGSVVAFKTAGEKYGLAHVSAITTGDTGTITIDVKVQK